MEICWSYISKEHNDKPLKSSDPFTVFSTNQVLIILVYDFKGGIFRKVKIQAIKINKRSKNKIDMKGRKNLR